MVELAIERKLTLDRQPGMVHIKRPDGRCVACIEAAAFEFVRQALLEEFMAVAERVSRGGQSGR